jgi:protein-tyrosine phosphatase
MSQTDIWQRFKEVTEHIPSDIRHLFRSSAPYYNGQDEPQNIDENAVEFLVQHNIHRIISLNGCSYTENSIELLAARNISYLHLPVEDFTAPTLEQINAATAMWSKKPDANTLVHCGYGQGRTGTMVTAIQIWETGGNLDLEKAVSENGVERDVQREVLEEYQKERLKLTG